MDGEREGSDGAAAVARAALAGAAAALAPFAEEAVRAGLVRAARRWPAFTRETVLPALHEALDGDGGPPHRGRREAAAYAGALVLGAAAAAAAWSRR